MGCFTPTDAGARSRALDEEGEVVGFPIHAIRSFKQPPPAEFGLASEVSADEVASVNARRAALEWGVGS